MSDTEILDWLERKAVAYKDSSYRHVTIDWYGNHGSMRDAIIADMQLDKRQAETEGEL